MISQEPASVVLWRKQCHHVSLLVQERESMVKTHQSELKKLHHKLDSHADTSLDHFRQTAMVRTEPRHETSHWVEATQEQV